MAILIQPEGRRISWSLIIGIVLFIMLLLISTYYLFFSGPPFIDTLFKSDREKASKLSSINIDELTLEADKILKYPDGKSILKDKDEERIGVPRLEKVGRENPFAQLGVTVNSANKVSK